MAKESPYSINGQKRWGGYLFALGLGLALGWTVGWYSGGGEGGLLESEGSIEVRFSPRGGCTDFIVGKVDSARRSVYVYAYSFTSKPIAQALLRAKRRGVEVGVLADYSASKGRGCCLRELKQGGIPVGIDRVPGLAHNKVMIIDERWVITGSFNWSAAAEYRNAENVVCICSNELARRYRANWVQRAARAYLFEVLEV